MHDPFAGGGSTLVEAARLGASVSGTDVDPLAVELVRHEIESFDEQAFGRAADRLFEFQREESSEYALLRAIGFPLVISNIRDRITSGEWAATPVQWRIAKNEVSDEGQG